MTSKSLSRSLPLNEKEGSRLYWELSKKGAYCNGEKFPWKYERLTDEKFFVLAFLQSRYDPRLLAVLIDLFLTHDICLHPILFKEALRGNEALTIAAVIGEFILEQKNSDLFRYLLSCANPVPTQLFYKNLYKLGGHKMQDVIHKPLWHFKKWGFLATDPPLLKERKKRKRSYLYEYSGRLQIVKQLARENPSFQLKDYLNKISFSISRQQALKDLSSLKWLKKRGVGKGTTYYVNKIVTGQPVSETLEDCLTQPVKTSGCRQERGSRRRRRVPATKGQGLNLARSSAGS